ncbi:MAG: beta-galactosidase [Kiritimatiellae bacterium]|nr:beta-galactosidase [Kiritimatiellia bacterium]
MTTPPRVTGWDTWTRVIVCLAAGCLCGPAFGQGPAAEDTPPAADIVWQIGVPDDSNEELLVWHNGEFAISRVLMQHPGFDLATHTFRYALKRNGVHRKLDFTGNISSPGSANPAWVDRVELSWQDDGEAVRLFEIRHKVARTRAGRVHKNRDPPDAVHPTLRATLPDGRVAHSSLLGADEDWRTLRSEFRARRGRNTIVLEHTWGSVYRQNHPFDFLRLSRQPAFTGRNEIVVEISPASGFLHRTIYDMSVPAAIRVDAYNLDAGPCRGKLEFVDFFERTVAPTPLDLQPDHNGHASAEVACPRGAAGHFRAVGSLSKGGRAVPLQTGLTNVVTRLAAVRRIAPLSDEEIDASFVGLCGIACGGFSLYQDTNYWHACYDEYRAFRRLLQVHHERLHSISWDNVEPREGDYRWSFYDRELRAEAEERVRLQVGLMCTPEWLAKRLYPDRKYVHDGRYSMPGLAEWDRFVTAFVTRYKDILTDVEIWNEPSQFSLFWHKATADDYFNLVKTASLAAKRIKPDVQITAQTIWAQQFDFVARQFELGVAKYVDQHADHGGGWSRKKQRSAELLARYGVTRGQLNNEAYNARSDRRAGETWEQGLQRAARRILWNDMEQNAHGVERIYEFRLTGPTETRHGMVGPTHEPKFSFSAFKTLVNRTTGARFHCRLNLGRESVTGYVYTYFSDLRRRENRSDTIVFVNSSGRDPQTVRLFVRNPCVRIVDLMDNERELAAPGGELVLTMGADPVMILGADLKALEMQNALTAEPARLDLAPGETAKAVFALSAGAGASGARCTVDFDGLGGKRTEEVAGRLRDGRWAFPVAIGLAPNAPTACHTISARVDFLLGTQRGAALATVPVVVSQVRQGEDLLPPNVTEEVAPHWRIWGDARGSEQVVVDRMTGEKSIRISIAKEDGTGGMALEKNVPVAPGLCYALVGRVRGKGSLAVHRTAYDADGKRSGRVDVSFYRAKITPEHWTDMAVKVNPDRGTARLGFSFLLYKERGDIELSGLRIVRVLPDAPVNRMLLRAEAHGLDGFKADGRLDEWKGRAFLPLGGAAEHVKGYADKDDLSARWCAAWTDGRLYLACEVTDDRDDASVSDARRMYETDSIQLYIDPLGRNAGVGKGDLSGFNVGRIGNRTVVFRRDVTPTETISDDYRPQRDPKLVTAKVSRQGSKTVYEMEMGAWAIYPDLVLQQGAELPISILVNDNDGAGRKGWIEWGSGIGDNRGSEGFGLVRLVE